MKKLAIFALILFVSIAAFAQEPEPEPEYLWTETITLEAGQTLDLVALINGKPGGGFFATSDHAFRVNADTTTTMVGFTHSSTAVITALAACDVVVKAIK